ncbi:MAG TPA: LON peptidase substrate-binding domain-containing protein [Pseudonocardiaceae bacterium]|nr:LON peptidase substrate-binding domain-containing protein [Pseudonocardiaceae bacterium]
MAETVPLFPLGTVLLPGASLPLHIFEPRYRQLTVDLVTGAVPGRSFGVIAVKQGLETAEETTHDIGCTAVLREARRLPDGRFDIVTRGEKRFRLLDIDQTSAPYLVGSVEWVPDDDPPNDELLLPMLSRAAREAHRRYCSAAWQHGEWNEPAADVGAAALPHLLAADCLLTLEDRQALLEECDPANRLRLVRTLLVREAAFLRALRAVPVPLNQFAVQTSRN